MDKAKIEAARTAVDAYRLAHTQLYKDGWNSGIPAAHEPLLSECIGELKKHGYDSLDVFFKDSHAQNLDDLGLTGKENLTLEDLEALRGKWR